MLQAHKGSSGTFEDGDEDVWCDILQAHKGSSGTVWLEKARRIIQQLQAHKGSSRVRLERGVGIVVYT